MEPSIFKNIIIPLITLSIALLTIFVDTKEIKSIKDLFKKRSFLFLLILLFISSCSNIYYSYDESQEAQTTFKNFKEEVTLLTDSINNKCIKTMESSIRGLLDSLKTLV